MNASSGRREQLDAAAFGLRLRAEAVAHFLRESRESRDRAALSALVFHAAGLRERAGRALVDLGRGGQ